MENISPHYEFMTPYIGDTLYEDNNDFRKWVDKLTFEYSEVAQELSTLELEIEKLDAKHFSFDYTDTELALFNKHGFLQERKTRTHDQLWHARESGQYLLYADEADLSVFKKYIGIPGQLGYKFNLPKNLPISPEAEDNSSILASLPFVSTHTSRLARASGFEPHTEIRGRIDFPLERIIGVESFGSWEGRGIRGHGGKGHWYDKEDAFAGTSKGHITSMAMSIAVELKDTGTSDSRVEIIRDATDDYWGISTGDCSHRIALAKLLGHDTFPIGNISIPSEDDMARLPYSVIKYFK